MLDGFSGLVNGSNRKHQRIREPAESLGHCEGRCRQRGRADTRPWLAEYLSNDLGQMIEAEGLGKHAMSPLTHHVMDGLLVGIAG